MNKQSLLKKALRELRDMRQRFARIQTEKKADVAIVGMACRFPGDVATPEEFWTLLCSGRDVITEMPHDRWDVDAFYDTDIDAAGKYYARRGGFLRQIDGFDARFFGIAPREALSMDPRQRLMLELTWEALERANCAVDSLYGTQTGVFLGMGGGDFALLEHKAGSPLDAYYGTGCVHSVAAGRISFILGLEGPSLVVETACSSALIATHLAMQSLRLGESDIALVGAVNLLLTPEMFVSFSKARMLAPDGRCKTFDASANGYVRGEGAGILVLKRLRDAEEQGDRILAVIAGSAVNQDGASGGLTVPSGQAQERVIRQAMADAGVAAHDVSYVEAHGTGTELGDPIEVHALGRVMDGRPSPLLIGSVKSNIGHLETAAGMAGLIKVILSLQNKRIPPSLHFETPNPKIDWERVPIRVASEEIPWDPDNGPRIAGVSSFSFMGTNAHIVLREYVPSSIEGIVTAPYRPLHLLPLCARSDIACRELATRYASTMTESSATASTLCASAGAGRSHDMDYRLAVIGADKAEFARKLDTYVREQKANGVLSRRTTSEPRIAFLFTGQGAQYAGMGRALYDIEPHFRRTLDRCAEILRPRLARPLLDVMFARPGSSLATEVHNTAYSQPALVCFEYALATLLSEWGVRPAVLMGHSVGEIAGACVAGVLSLEDGLSFAVERGRLMQGLQRNGGMVAVSATAQYVASHLAGLENELAIAAINAPESVVISGHLDPLVRMQRSLEESGRRATRLQVSHAFHSPLMQPILHELSAFAARLNYGSPSTYVVSSVTGKFVQDEWATPDYWVRQVCDPVRFHDGMRTLGEAGFKTFIEIGPKPTLVAMGRHCLDDEAAVWLPTQRPSQDWHTLLRTIAELYVRGVPINWSKFALGQRQANLPTYPFQRRRYWPTSRTTVPHDLHDERKLPRGQPCETAKAHIAHPLLGSRLNTPLADALFESQLSPCEPVYLRDHRVHQYLVVPASVYLEMVMSAGSTVTNNDRCDIHDMVFHNSALLDANGVNIFQTIVHKATDGTRRIDVHGRASSAPYDSWIHHVSANVTEARAIAPTAPVDLYALQRSMQALDVKVYYEELSRRGLKYGEAFQALNELYAISGESLALISLPEKWYEPDTGYRLHPVIIDACFQASIAGIPGSKGRLYLPANFNNIRILSPIPPRVYAHAHSHLSTTGDSLHTNILLYDEDGHLIAKMDGLRGASISGNSLTQSGLDVVQRNLFRVSWYPHKPNPVHSSNSADRIKWVILAGLSNQGTLAQELARQLAERGVHHRVIDTDHIRSAESLCRTLNEIGPVHGMVYLPGIGVSTEYESCMQGVIDLAYAVQEVSTLDDIPIWLVTRGAQQVACLRDGICPEGAMMWGFGRTLAQEQPQVRWSLIDLDPTDSLHSSTQILTTLFNESDEPQIAWESGRAYVPRLVRDVDEYPYSKERILQLATPRMGDLGDLELRSVRRIKPAMGQVEIAVRAAGLNFRDVLRALGMMTGVDAELDAKLADVPYGIECAGLITEVGDDVSRFAVGDAVVAVLAVGSLGTSVIVRQEFVCHKPASVSFATAASVPLAFVTAHYGLVHLAGIQKDDRVLIHAAAGGVGMAAVQIALRAGAEVFATASPSKWERLRALGVHHIMNSRSLDFADEIAKLSNGNGVNIVLNSLSGSFIEKSIQVCALSARFIEIGKIGIWDSDQVYSLRPDIAYIAFDLGDVAEVDSSLVDNTLKVIMDDIQDGSLHTLPVERFPLSQASDAFAHMAHAKHVGKIVLVNNIEQRHVPARVRNVESTGDSYYLITGGLGILGLLVAEWLIERGVKHLILVSHRAPDESAEAVIRQFRKAGVRVVVERANVTSRTEIQHVIEPFSKGEKRLRCVYHLAGKLDDCAIADLDWKRLDDVLAPKILGARNLVELTDGIVEDRLVLFSSATATLGNPGQASYAAANGFLDALAHQLRASGVPGQSIGWGGWAGLGMASSDASSRLASRMGVDPISHKENLDIMNYIEDDVMAYSCVIQVDWPTYARRVQGHMAPRFLARLMTSTEEALAKPIDGQQDIWTRLSTQAPQERERTIKNIVHDGAKQVLGYETSDAVDLKRPLMEQGFDSLMAVEFRNLLDRKFRSRLPASLIFDYPTISKIVQFLLNYCIESSEDPSSEESERQERQTDTILEADSVLQELTDLLGTHFDDQ